MTTETPQRQPPQDATQRHIPADSEPRPAARDPGLRTAPARRRRVLVPLAVTLVLGVAAAFSVYVWHQNRYFISTDNASITGAMAQVTSPNAGRIFEIRHDVGEVVSKNDSLAVVDIPISTTLPLGGSRATFLDARDRLIDVPCPVDGVVVSRNVNVGDTVSANQTLFTVVDTRNLWVVANIEETKVGRVRPGQPVEVYVDVLHRTLDGSVEAVIPATISTFSLFPTQNAAGNFTKIVQLVPVKIALHTDDPALIVGSSASVRIHLP